MAKVIDPASEYDTYIRQALATAGAHLRIGPFGFILYFARDGWLSGYDSEAVKAECIAAGLPIIDTRDMPIAARHRLAVRGPLVAVGEAPDDPPWQGLSQAPLAVVAALYRAAGAEIINAPEQPPAEEDSVD